MRGDYKLFDKVDRCLSYSHGENATIHRLLSSNLTHAEIWGGKLTNSGVTWKERGDIIIKIKSELSKIQDGYCYFCGFKFGYKVGLQGNHNIHREHFAPKSIYREFTFTAENLILACSLCNGTDYKGDFDTISKYSSDYSSCEFNIIHPYFDKRSDYLKLDQETGVMEVVNNEVKGVNTERLFGLNEPSQVENRRMHILFDIYQVDSLNEVLIEFALSQNYQLK